MLFQIGLVPTLLLIPAVIVATVLHELAHGAVAAYFGDPTARNAGRLTLNPLPHIDPIGALMLLFLGFGWAKPVPVDPRYFRHPYRDMILVALAGPVTNGLLAFVIAFLTVVVALRFPGAPSALLQAMQDGVIINVSLGIFNLIPIPPLDGAHFVTGLYPTAYRWLVRFGGILLLVLVLTGVVGRVIGPLVLGVSNGFLEAAQAVL